MTNAEFLNYHFSKPRGHAQTIIPLTSFYKSYSDLNDCLTHNEIKIERPSPFLD